MRAILGVVLFVPYFQGQCLATNNIICTNTNANADAYGKGASIRQELRCNATDATKRGYLSTAECLRATDAAAIMAAQAKLCKVTVQVGRPV